MAAKYKRKAPSAGVVYFVEAEGCGLIKIGFTARPLRFRLVQLRAQSPVPLAVLGVIDARPEREKEIHAQFLRLWCHGEWFRGDDDLRAFVSGHARPWDAEPLPAGRPIVSMRPKAETLAEWAERTMLTYQGVTRSAAEWCRRNDRSVLSMKMRLQNGFPVERLLGSNVWLAPAIKPGKRQII